MKIANNVKKKIYNKNETHIIDVDSPLGMIPSRPTSNTNYLHLMNDPGHTDITKILYYFNIYSSRGRETTF